MFEHKVAETVETPVTSLSPQMVDHGAGGFSTSGAEVGQGSLEGKSEASPTAACPSQGTSSKQAQEDTRNNHDSTTARNAEDTAYKQLQEDTRSSRSNHDSSTACTAEATRSKQGEDTRDRQGEDTRSNQDSSISHAQLPKHEGQLPQHEVHEEQLTQQKKHDDKQHEPLVTTEMSIVDKNTAAKYNTPRGRLADYLLAVKLNKQEAKQTSQPKVEPHVDASAAEGLLPEAPADMNRHEYISADQQKPPKPRGRKRKDSAAEQTACATKEKPKRGKRVAKAKAKAKHTKQTKNKQAKPAYKKLRLTRKKSKSADSATVKPAGNKRNKKRASKKHDAEIEAAKGPVTSSRRRSQSIQPSKIQLSKKKVTQYTPLELPSDANMFDAYAHESAACGIDELAGKKSNKPKPVTPVARPGVVVEEPGHFPPEEALSKPRAKTTEQKQRYSRKSCAYQKVLRQQLADGVDREEAKVAARKVAHIQL